MHRVNGHRLQPVLRNSDICAAGGSRTRPYVLRSDVVLFIGDDGGADDGGDVADDADGFCFARREPALPKW
jgi:hypothetical protein